ncbi:ABC transporter permease [Collinsella sp. An7]|uniref:SufB/SufD family protein n=1 Tax=Collinsella sp. An7 TaxID=1965651 RepID=UPI000B36C51F|nr:SufD family Fe-S cluster assembly protein [Collinsella sp. An7]OUN46650.1 ABC transporter permease [Collinsella sp. An7]
MDALAIKHASAMPAPTWGWLKMNDARIDIPAGLARGDVPEVDAPQALFDTAVSFEGAVAELQERLDAARNTTPDTRACVCAVQGAATAPSDAANTDGNLGDLDIPALSSYQERAVRDELAGDVARAFETGIGIDARAYLNFLAGESIVLGTAEGATEQVTVRVAAEADCASAASVDLVAAPESTLDVVLELDGTDDFGGADDAPALIGSTMRIFAGACSRVNVTVYTTALPGTVALDDEGYVLDDGARVTVRHVVLGGGTTATGLAADLRCDTARIDIDTSYLAGGTERRDLAYTVRHRGKKTISNIIANGVLAGTAQKTLRGTIDLVHGCKGSEGTERETVLIASKGVDNKTVPTILCDEDDVAGNHGATIGHVRPDQLFYLMCRGVSEADAEALFLRAKFEDAALTAPSERVRRAVCRLAERAIDDFEEEFA